MPGGFEMYPPLTTFSNRVALVAGLLLMCLAAQSRAEHPAKAPSAEQPAPAEAILFSSDGGLWVINSDQSGLKQLYHFKPNQAYEVQAAVSVSPDGSRIAYVNYRRLEGSPLLHPNVWVMNADGSGVTPLTAEPKRHFGPLAWSPDGHKLAAVSLLTDFDEHKQIKYLTEDIFLVNADGSGAKSLIHFTDPGIHVQQVSWSPDGRKIAFFWTQDHEDDQKRKGLNENIWVMDADGSHVIPLTRFTGISPWIWGEIGWSPDSRRVTYISDRALDGSDVGGAGFNIWVSNADGSGSLPLTRFRKMFGTLNAFSWSPDGSRLSFSSNDSLDGSDTVNSSVNVWVMKADGSAPLPLTRETEIGLSNDRPAWSPDGSFIAFASCINPTSDKPRRSPGCKLSIMKEDGTGARQLTEQNAGWFQWRQ
jgi:Tol biopolymer transport system component